MKCNIGTSGRAFRFVLALLILFYAGWKPSAIAFTISLFVFYEAVAGWCVVYQILGKNKTNF